jgi:glycerol-3-phosphate dehydrogenase
VDGEEPSAGRRFSGDWIRGRGRQAEGSYPFLEESACAPAGSPLRHQGCALLGQARKTEDLGRCFGSDLYEVEVRYLIDHEWARHADDVLWRRTKEGLRLTKEAGCDTGGVHGRTTGSDGRIECGMWSPL